MPTATWFPGHGQQRPGWHLPVPAGGASPGVQQFHMPSSDVLLTMRTEPGPPLVLARAPIEADQSWFHMPKSAGAEPSPRSAVPCAAPSVVAPAEPAVQEMGGRLWEPGSLPTQPLHLAVPSSRLSLDGSSSGSTLPDPDQPAASPSGEVLNTLSPTSPGETCTDWSVGPRWEEI